MPSLNTRLAMINVLSVQKLAESYVEAPCEFVGNANSRVDKLAVMLQQALSELSEATGYNPNESWKG